MKQVKLEMSGKVVHLFLELVHEESIPVNVNTGIERKELNGGTMIDVLLEYDESDEVIINQILNEVVNDSMVIKYE